MILAVWSVCDSQTCASRRFGSIQRLSSSCEWALCNRTIGPEFYAVIRYWLDGAGVRTWWARVGRSRFGENFTRFVDGEIGKLGATSIRAFAERYTKAWCGKDPVAVAAFFFTERIANHQQRRTVARTRRNRGNGAKPHGGVP